MTTRTGLKPAPTGIVRVYTQARVIVHTSDPQPTAVKAVNAARRHIRDYLQDRVPDNELSLDVKIEGIMYVAQVSRHMPVMKGEFKSHALAREWLSRQQRGFEHTGVEIVVKNSQRDHEIRTASMKRQT